MKSLEFNPLSGKFDFTFEILPFHPFTTYDCGYLFILFNEDFSAHFIDCGPAPADCTREQLDFGKIGDLP